MELLRYIDDGIRNKYYTLNDIYNQHIAIKFNNKEDFVKFINLVKEKNTVRAFNAEQVWIEYIMHGKDRGYNGMIVIDLDIDSDEDYNYDFRFDFGHLEYYQTSQEILCTEYNYIIVEYTNIRITDWSI